MEAGEGSLTLVFGDTFALAMNKLYGSRVVALLQNGGGALFQRKVHPIIPPSASGCLGAAAIARRRRVRRNAEFAPPIS